MEDSAQNKSPPGLLRFSEATNRLAAGMWGGLPRPLPVQQIKQTDRNVSVGFGPWGEQARQRLTRAAVDGELPVYVVAEGAERVVVPTDVLASLPKSRGGLSDIPSRVPLKVARRSDALFRILTTGCLVVGETEFLVWYKAERTRGQWSSQRSRAKLHGGRPTKQTERLSSSILTLVHDGKWRADAPIVVLHHILSAEEGLNVPSPDTLGRLIDRLFLETGEPGLHRPQRRSPKPRNIMNRG